MKSLVFPKYLFLFRTAPLGITAQLLQHWQQGLLDFVWQYKKHRLSKDLLCSSKQMGGLGFPDLAEYHRATLLAAFAKRYSSSFTAPWKDLMQEALLPYDFMGVVWNEKLGQRLLNMLSPINQASLKAWWEFKRKRVPENSIYRSFLHQKWFPPGEKPSSFLNWKDGGVTTFRDVIEGRRLRTRENIEAKYNIRVPWLEYRQLHHLIQELESRGGLDYTTPPLDLLVAGSPLPDSGLLSTIYRSLITLRSPMEFAYQKAWRRELQSNLGDQQWLEMRSSSLFHSCSVNILMTSQKIMLRWHLTPDKLHKMSPTISDKCWKGCGQRATHTHCYWACPRLRGFWDTVFRQISIIFGQTIVNGPELAILNLWGKTKLDGSRKALVELLMCAARMLITSYWKSQRIPSSRDWYLKVWDLYLQDKVLVTLLKSENVPMKAAMMDKWKPLIHATKTGKIDASLFATMSTSISWLFLKLSTFPLFFPRSRHRPLFFSIS